MGASGGLAAGFAEGLKAVGATLAHPTSPSTNLSLVTTEAAVTRATSYECLALNQLRTLTLETHRYLRQVVNLGSQHLQPHSGKTLRLWKVDRLCSPSSSVFSDHSLLTPGLP